MGPTSIDSLINGLWKDLLIVAERHEKQMLANRALNVAIKCMM